MAWPEYVDDCAAGDAAKQAEYSAFERAERAQGEHERAKPLERADALPHELRVHDAMWDVTELMRAMKRKLHPVGGMPNKSIR